MKKRSPLDRPRPLRSSAYAASPWAANWSPAQAMYPLCALNPWTSTITARGGPFGCHDRVKMSTPSAVLKDDSFMLAPLGSNDPKPMVAGVDDGRAGSRRTGAAYSRPDPNAL